MRVVAWPVGAFLYYTAIIPKILNTKKAELEHPKMKPPPFIFEIIIKKIYGKNSCRR